MLYETISAEYCLLFCSMVWLYFSYIAWYYIDYNTLHFIMLYIFFCCITFSVPLYCTITLYNVISYHDIFDSIGRYFLGVWWHGMYVQRYQWKFIRWEKVNQLHTTSLLRIFLLLYCIYLNKHTALVYHSKDDINLHI